eukprot:12279653-Ditylum_brightwellii.AAC.1
MNSTQILVLPAFLSHLLRAYPNVSSICHGYHCSPVLKNLLGASSKDARMQPRICKQPMEAFRDSLQ